MVIEKMYNNIENLSSEEISKKIRNLTKSVPANIKRINTLKSYKSNLITREDWVLLFK